MLAWPFDPRTFPRHCFACDTFYRCHHCLFSSGSCLVWILSEQWSWTFSGDPPSGQNCPINLDIGHVLFLENFLRDNFSDSDLPALTSMRMPASNSMQDKKRERTRSLSQRFSKVSVISFLPGDPASFGQYLIVTRGKKHSWKGRLY